MLTLGYLLSAFALQAPGNTKVVIDAAGQASMAELSHLRGEEDACTAVDCMMQGTASGNQVDGCKCECTDGFTGEDCDAPPKSIDDFEMVTRPTDTAHCAEEDMLGTWNNYEHQRTLGACLAKCKADPECKFVSFSLFEDLGDCNDETGETCTNFGECTGHKACTMTDNKRGEENDVVYEKKVADNEEAVGVAHLGEQCYQSCNETPGPCDYCGTGYCCHFGQTDEFCDGTMGAEHVDGHVCAEPPSGDLLKKAAEGTEKEEDAEEAEKQAEEEAKKEAEEENKTVDPSKAPPEPKEPGCYLWMPSGCAKNNWNAADTAWYKDPRHDKTTCLESAASDYDKWCETANAQAIFIGSDGTAKAGAEESFVVSLRADGPIVEGTFIVEFMDQPTWFHTNADLTMGALRTALATVAGVNEAEVHFAKCLAYSESWKGGDLLATAAVNDPQWEPALLRTPITAKASFLGMFARTVVNGLFGEGRSGRLAERGAPSSSLLERARKLLEDPEPEPEAPEETYSGPSSYIMGTFAIKQEAPGVLTNALKTLEAELGEKSAKLHAELQKEFTALVDGASASDADWAQAAMASINGATAKLQKAEWKDKEEPVPTEWSGSAVFLLSALLFA